MKVSSFFPFLAVAVVWTWPAAHLDPEVLVSRQFDLYPTVWLLARAHDVPLNLVHAESAWPVGELLARADSFVLLALGWLFGWIDAREIGRAHV